MLEGPLEHAHGYNAQVYFEGLECSTVCEMEQNMEN